MLPLADMHVHLLAGLDDGPRERSHAVAMAKSMAAQGVRYAHALAHQNETWSGVTSDRIREAVKLLAADLAAANVDLQVVPGAEVAVRVDLMEAWHQGELLSVADQARYMLLELPHDLFLDLRDMARLLVTAGIRPILAHPERTPEMLLEAGLIEELIEIGCLVQVSSKSIVEPKNGENGRAVRDWCKRGVVHLIGSDGHSPNRRPPVLAPAIDKIRHWAGASAADRIGSTNALAVLHDLPLRLPPPQPARRKWWAWV